MRHTKHAMKIALYAVILAVNTRVVMMFVSIRKTTLKHAVDAILPASRMKFVRRVHAKNAAHLH